MIIKKKAWPEQFKLILDGKKKFDIRLADFECKIGDILLLEEFDPIIQKYTGRKIEKKITYISKTRNLKFWNKEEIDKHGLQIISLE